MKYNKENITKESISEAIKNSKSMISAARYLNISRDKFKKYAQFYGLYEPNQCGRGISKVKIYKDKSDIFCQNSNASLKVIKKWLIQNRGHKCELCGITEWNGKPISLEMDHIDGNHNNNEESNLRLLCPNCHSQTDTFRGKNMKKSNHKKINDSEFVNALQNNSNIRNALMELNLVPAGANYKRAEKIITKYGLDI